MMDITSIALGVTLAAVGYYVLFLTVRAAVLSALRAARREDTPKA